MLVEIDWEKGGLNHVTLLVLDLRLGVVGAAGAGSSQASLRSYMKLTLGLLVTNYRKNSNRMLIKADLELKICYHRLSAMV